jgi:hypothetical protein
MADHFTPQQLLQSRGRTEALGVEGMRRAQADWAALLAAVEAERVAGTDPADARLDPLVARWRELIGQFTGGDRGIHHSLNRVYADEAPSARRAARCAARRCPTRGR